MNRTLVGVFVASLLVASCSSAGHPSAGPALRTHNHACPTGSSSVRAHFDPIDPIPGVNYDIEVPHGLTGLRVVHAGDLALPSGRLITGSGGDIAFPDGRTAVDLGIAGGRYDVSLLMANLDGGNRRVAFAELALRPSPPVRWEDAPTLFFATDGGDGGYMSEEAAEYASTGNGSWRFASLDYASRQQPYPPCELIEFIDRRPLNAVIFATGWGDGRYPTVLGYDRGGNVSAVVTYTFVVPWRLAGLPGEPPMEVRNEEQRRARERGN